MEKEQEDVLTLLDEDGTEHRFSVQEVLEVEGESYFILLPEDDEEEDEDEDEDEDEEQEEDEEELEYVIFRVETVGKDEQLVLVDDDEELERVASAWADLEDDWDDESGDAEWDDEGSSDSDSEF